MIRLWRVERYVFERRRRSRRVEVSFDDSSGSVKNLLELPLRRRRRVKSHLRLFVRFILRAGSVTRPRAGNRTRARLKRLFVG